MTPTEARDYLYDLPRWASAGEAAYEPGLERIRALLEEMGDPQEAYPIVHVGGTNGKGSTASFLAAIGSARGERIGLHTSPHLQTVRERMRVDGRPVDAETFTEAVERWQSLFEEVRPSFFEATLALSLWHLAEAAVDRAIVEVGMGGRLDATNALTPELAIITHVGLDHTRFLGETLAEIAREKSGIVKEGVPVLIGPMPTEAASVIAEVAAGLSAPLHVLEREVTARGADEASMTEGGRRAEEPGLYSRITAVSPEAVYPALEIGLLGPHQTKNALLALRAAELLYPLPSPASEAEKAERREAIATGLREVKARAGLRARMDLAQEEPPVIIDVAHNTESLEVTLEAVRAAHLDEEAACYVLLGLMADKDVSGMAEVLAGRVEAVYPVELSGERALPASDLRARLAEAGVPLVAEEEAGPEPTVEAGLAWHAEHAGPKDALLCTGSHRVAGAVLDLLEPVRTGEEDL